MMFCKLRYSPVFLFTVIISMSIFLACGSNQEVDFAPQPASTPIATSVASTSPPPVASKSAPAVEAKIMKQYTVPPRMGIDQNKKYMATFEMANGGVFVVELFPKEAPNTVNSFVFLARDGFYDGVTFHRVIPGFMAQGGDPSATGMGGPGYQFGSELSPDRRHDAPGVLSMANSGGLNTNGSQFFITFVATPALDGYASDGSLKDCARRGVSCHTVFGKVVDGLDVALGITPRDPGTARTAGDAIKTIKIEEGDVDQASNSTDY